MTKRITGFQMMIAVTVFGILVDVFRNWKRRRDR